MKKKDVIRTIAAAANCNKTVAASVYEALTGAVESELEQHGEAILPGIVKLTRSTRAARRGRNLRTGEAIDIPARQVIKAKALHPVNTVGIL